MFKSSKFEDVSLNQWMALTPKEVVQQNVNASRELMKSLRKEKWPVVKFPGFTYYPKKTGKTAKRVRSLMISPFLVLDPAEMLSQAFPNKIKR